MLITLIICHLSAIIIGRVIRKYAEPHRTSAILNGNIQGTVVPSFWNALTDNLKVGLAIVLLSAADPWLGLLSIASYGCVWGHATGVIEIRTLIGLPLLTGIIDSIRVYSMFYAGNYLSDYLWNLPVSQISIDYMLSTMTLLLMGFTGTFASTSIETNIPPKILRKCIDGI